MDVRNCAKCGRIFQYLIGAPICPKCKEKEEEEFQLVKTYIYDNKNANMMEVSNQTGVQMKLIERFIREGRLMLSEDSPIFLRCEKCGTQIRTGRYCQSCSTSLSNEIRMGATQTPSENVKSDDPNKNKMHFLNKDRI